MEAACKLVKKMNPQTGKKERIEPISKEKVDELLARYGIKLENNVLYDYVYWANQCKADTFKSSVPDEAHMALYIKDMVDDPDAAAQRGVRSMVARKATVIMIDGIAVNEKNAEDWDAALQSARKAGVPVILLDPVAPPDDDTLFAVTFTLTGKGDGVTALDDAVVTIVDDKPHPRTMNVTDNLS